MRLAREDLSANQSVSGYGKARQDFSAPDGALFDHLVGAHWVAQ
jgi:hypothetical protein